MNKRIKLVCLSMACMLIVTPLSAIAAEVEGSQDVEEVIDYEIEEVEEIEEIEEAAEETITEIENDEEQSEEELVDETEEEAVEEEITVSTMSIYPCQTECTLDHDHQTEICEIDYYGTFLDWTTVPYVWEFVYDNSDACWGWGLWDDGFCYTTPANEYDTDVRHKIALYSDGEYLYLDIIHATVYASGARGSTLTFTVDGVVTQFQLLTETGNSLDTVKTAGTYEVYLVHDLGDLAGEYIEDSAAMLYVNDTLKNSEYEVKIPLSALADQNGNINLENINEITFSSASLTYKGVTITGISTYPLVLAGICIAGVGYIVYKRNKKKISIGV